MYEIMAFATRRKSFNYWYLMVLFFISLSFVPIVKYYVPYRYIGGVMVLMAFFAWLKMMAYRVPHQSMFYGGVACIMFYFVVYKVMRALSSDVYGKFDTSLLIDLTLQFLPFLLFQYSLIKGYVRELKMCVIVIIFCCLCGAVANMKGEYGMARVLAQGTVKTVDEAWQRSDAIIGGMMGFGLVYASVIIVTVLLYHLNRFPRKWFFVVVAAIVVLIIGIVRASYTIAIIQLILSIGLVILSKIVKRKMFRVLAWAITIAFCVSTSFPQVYSFLRQPLISLAESIDVPEYKMRIESIVDAISGVTDTYAVNRTQLYRNSLNQFLEHPIGGCFVADALGAKRTCNFVANDADWIGGHSFFFDGLGGVGIVGFSLMVAGLILYVKYIFALFRFYGCEEAIDGWTCCFLPVVFEAVVNTSGFYEVITALFVIAPTVFIFFRRGAV